MFLNTVKLKATYNYNKHDGRERGNIDEVRRNERNISNYIIIDVIIKIYIILCITGCRSVGRIQSNGIGSKIQTAEKFMTERDRLRYDVCDTDGERLRRFRRDPQPEERRRKKYRRVILPTNSIAGLRRGAPGISKIIRGFKQEA